MKEQKRIRYNGLTPFDGSVGFLTAVIAMLVISMASTYLIADANVSSIVYSFISQLCFAVIPFLYAFSACRRDCRDLKNYTVNTLYSLGFTKRTKPSLIIIAVLLPLFSILAFLPVSTLVEYVFALMGYVNPPSYADYTSTPALFIICIFALCLFPAFGEEIMVRGAFMHGLRTKGTVFAMLISATMFALLHGSPTQFIHQFLIAIIMAYMVLLTDCIWHSIIFHFINNFSVIVYEYIYVHSGATYMIPLWAYFVMFVVGLIGVAGLLVAFTYCAVKGTDFKERLNTEVAQNGKIKGAVKALFDTSEYKYKSYDKTKCIMLYATIGLLLLLWLLNTISGWMSK